MDPTDTPFDPGSPVIDHGSQVFAGVGLVLGLFALFFIAVIGFMIFAVTRRYRAAKNAGLDPFAGDIQVMGKVANSAVLAPQITVEQRLAEVDGLLAAGTITAAEHQAARARILATL
jgi:hypothetical protein